MGIKYVYNFDTDKLDAIDIQIETDPVFSAWLINTPPLYSETDPAFNSWLSNTPPLYPGGWYDTSQGNVNVGNFYNDVGYLTYWSNISSADYATNANYASYAGDSSYWSGYSFPYYNYGTPGYFYNDGYGGLSFQNIDLSGYVPYTGAATTVDLGAQVLTTTGYITGELAKVTTDEPTAQQGNIWLDTDEVINYITTVTDTYDILPTDLTVICNKATDFTVTLPATVVGQTIIIKNINTGIVTIEGNSSDTIDGELNQQLNQWESITVQCYTYNAWVII